MSVRRNARRRSSSPFRIPRPRSSPATTAAPSACCGRRRQDGRRIALVGFDDFELAELLPVPVTVVATDSVELGRRAAQLLLERLAGDNGFPKTVVLPTTLVQRGSGEIGPP